MSETNTRVESFTELDDATRTIVDTLREKAFQEHGANWSAVNFYGSGTFMYSIGYHDDQPVCISVLQQHPDWIEMGVVGLMRRYYTIMQTDNGFVSDSLGAFGTPMFMDQYAEAKTRGLTKMMVSMERESFVRAMEGRLDTLEAITSEPWYVSSTKKLTLPNSPDCQQFVCWSGQEDCFFEDAPQ